MPDHSQSGGFYCHGGWSMSYKSFVVKPEMFLFATHWKWVEPMLG